MNPKSLLFSVLMFVILIGATSCSNKSNNDVKLTEEFASAIYSYDDFKEFSEKMLPVQKNGKWGFINSDGKEVIACKYDEVQNFHEGMAAVRKGYKWGYINMEGQEVIPCDYYSYFDEKYGEYCIDSFEDGYVRLMGIKNITDDDIEAEIEEYGYPIFGEGWDNKNVVYGYANKDGKIIIPLTYEDETSCYEALTAFKSKNSDKENVNKKRGSESDENDEKWKRNEDYEKGYEYFNSKGEVIIPANNYTQVQPFSCGLAGVERKASEDKYIYEYIDKTGKTIFTVKTDMWGWEGDDVWGFLSFFSEDLASVDNEDNKWGYIDINGNVVIPYIYDSASSFSNGVAKVSKDGVYGFVDKEGNDTFHGEGFGLAQIKKQKKELEEERQRIQEREEEQQRIREREEQERLEAEKRNKERERELGILSSLHQLQTESQGLIIEIDQLYRIVQRDGPIVNPNAYFKLVDKCNELVSIKKKQVEIARQLDDPELLREYKEQYRKIDEATNIMKHGDNGRVKIGY